MQGFDVGDVPLGSRVDGMLFPLPLSHCGRDHDNLAKLAIECYNEEHVSALFWLLKIFPSSLPPFASITSFLVLRFNLFCQLLGHKIQVCQARSRNHECSWWCDVLYNLSGQG